ncbi:MAG: response regulator [Magnetococcales bacterium]|nr:response regulator [Magnetococcales bacterium]
MRCLIVDDETINLEVMENLLAPYGTCVKAENGVQAVKIFQESLEQGQKFDLILLDILMPFMDGQETLKKIRQMEKNHYGTSLNRKDYAFVLMVTSLMEPDQLVESYMNGRCNGYITKPVDSDEMIKRLQRYHLI